MQPGKSLPIWVEWIEAGLPVIEDLGSGVSTHLGRVD